MVYLAFILFSLVMFSYDIVFWKLLIIVHQDVIK